MTLYALVLLVHSWLRWALLALLAATLLGSFSALRRGRPLSEREEKTHVFAVVTADLQLTLGLVLYFVQSPLVDAFWAAPKASMKDSVLRFFAIEHITVMIVGIALLHLGRSLTKKLPAEQRPKRVFRFTLWALLLILAGVPWPFLKSGRPIFRVDAGEFAAPIRQSSAPLGSLSESLPPGPTLVLT